MVRTPKTKVTPKPDASDTLREAVPENALVLAVDPGRNCGYSVWHRGRMLECSYLAPGWNAQIVDRIIQHHGPRASELGAQLVLAIEAQYLPRGVGGAAAISVIVNRCRWQVVAELSAVRVVLVAASTWQTQWLKWRRGEDPKALARAEMERLIEVHQPERRLVMVTQDMADAVCLGAYVSALHWPVVRWVAMDEEVSRDN